MNRPRLSVAIITLNEEENLPKCLNSIKEIADEIIVVDSGSKDKTVEIARKYGAKVFLREFDTYSNQKNFAQNASGGDWILSLDADEVVPPKLAKEIKEEIEASQYDGYLIPRRNIILGAEIRHTRWSPDKHIWLWRKGRGKWAGDVHEEVVVKGKVGEFKNAKVHYQHKTITEFLDMVNRYTELDAKEKIAKGVKSSYFRLFFDPTLSFLRRFIYKRGFLDGWRGFVLSYLMAIYRMTTWIKIWERQNV